MNESLEELYFNWLHAKIMLSNQPHKSYELLLKQMHKTEFVWLLSGDDNRAEDGLDLRNEFINQTHLEVDLSWFDTGCSVLEALYAFAVRAQFQTEPTITEWFWEFVSNLELSPYFDEKFNAMEVSEKLSVFVWRTYGYNGQGGLFPISRPSRDQRPVEIWGQFCDYLIDKDIF
jgi:hypothetical protein